MRHTDFSIDVTVTEMLNMMRNDRTPRKYARLLLEGAEIIQQLLHERNTAMQAMPKWIRTEDRPPELLEPVLVCRPKRAKNDPLTVDMGYLRPDGTWRVHGTPLNRIRGWMPLPPDMDDDDGSV